MDLMDIMDIMDDHLLGEDDSYLITPIIPITPMAYAMHLKFNCIFWV